MEAAAAKRAWLLDRRRSAAARRTRHPTAAAAAGTAAAAVDGIMVWVTLTSPGHPHTARSRTTNRHVNRVRGTLPRV
jgi:hypothetical protein